MHLDNRLFQSNGGRTLLVVAFFGLLTAAIKLSSIRQASPGLTTQILVVGSPTDVPGPSPHLRTVTLAPDSVERSGAAASESVAVSLSASLSPAAPTHSSSISPPSATADPSPSASLSPAAPTYSSSSSIAPPPTSSATVTVGPSQIVKPVATPSEPPAYVCTPGALSCVVRGVYWRPGSQKLLYAPGIRDVSAEASRCLDECFSAVFKTTLTFSSNLTEWCGGGSGGASACPRKRRRVKGTVLLQQSYQQHIPHFLEGVLPLTQFTWPGTAQVPTPVRLLMARMHPFDGATAWQHDVLKLIIAMLESEGAPAGVITVNGVRGSTLDAGGDRMTAPSDPTARLWEAGTNDGNPLWDNVLSKGEALNSGAWLLFPGESAIEPEPIVGLGGGDNDAEVAVYFDAVATSALRWWASTTDSDVFSALLDREYNSTTLAFPSLPPPLPPPPLLSLKGDSSSAPPPLYLDADVCIVNRAKTRRILNFDAVVDAVREITNVSAPRVLPSDYPPSLRSQIEWTRGCRLLVAPHGAGQSNIMFMRRGGRVLEVLPYVFNIAYYFRSLAHSSGHAYASYYKDDAAAVEHWTPACASYFRNDAKGSAAACNQAVQLCHFCAKEQGTLVDIPMFEALLRRLLREPPRPWPPRSSEEYQSVWLRVGATAARRRLGDSPDALEHSPEEEPRTEFGWFESGVSSNSFGGGGSGRWGARRAPL